MQNISTSAPAQHNDFPDFHPVLRPMCSTCEHMFERGDFERAFPLLHALIVLNSTKRAFQRVQL